MIFNFMLVLIPILFFIALELTLRFFNYGYDYRQWVESPNGQWVAAHGKYLLMNPELGHKYFHMLTHVPVSNEDAFGKVKSANSFRVFILGESTGAGFPYEPNGSFSKYIKDRLSFAYPDSKIEVVNCSMTAINSYTLLDLTPGILAERPDLILIYAGHNEYYGALGAGSVESLGDFRWIVNFAINMEKYRTFQMLRGFVNEIAGVFSGSREIPTGSMMAEMARDKYISYKSPIYERGLSQFEGNMGDILGMIKKAKVPVIIGTLVCNLKDQSPFVSASSSRYPAARSIFEEARQALAVNRLEEADSLFRYARDLDELRFRAPGEMNDIIRKLGQEYEVPVLDVDSAFDAESPAHITGNNLIVDHLHPTLQGYLLMGRLFYDKMEQMNYLPQTKPRNLIDRIQDSLTVANFNFSRTDSMIAEYKMVVLKNNWPFVEDGTEFSYSSFIRPSNNVDSLAAQFVEQKISWKNAHLFAAQWYIDNKDESDFLREMDALIDQYPYMTAYYELAAKNLIVTEKYGLADKYLSEACEIKPDAYTTKSLGIISLHNGETDSARLFLNQSLGFDARDAQVWLDLAVSYSKIDKNKSLKFADEALALAPDYQEALALRRQLSEVVK